MISIKMSNGNLEFTKIKGENEFWQRIINSLKIYNIECFYNERLGVDISILHEQDVAVYKLEHIKAKIKEWYKNEVISVDYEIISTTERIIKAKIFINHKEYSQSTREVTLHGKI